MKNTRLVALGIIGVLCISGVTIGALFFLRHQADVVETDPMSPGAGGNAGGRPNARETKFEALDTDRDGRLALAEFGVGRKPGEAAKWFERRDANHDGFVSRDEFLPFSATPKAQ